MLFNCFYAFTTALCASLIMVPFLRRWALDREALDVPDERKVHTTPTPRLGGIAIFLAFLFAAQVFAPADPLVRGLLAGGLIVFATGIADDLHGLTSRQKFAGQIIACLVTIAVSGLWLERFGDPLGIGPIVFPAWAGIPFTVFAVVGVTNAINLIDGLDGLAGGVSLLALAAYGILGLIDGDPLTPLLAAALIGAILGFLKYNFYPARIFMGDAGSLTTGFILGVLAVQLTQRPGGQMNVLAPVVVLGLPIFDALWVMTRRVLQRLSPFAPDRGHVHHKFLDLGLEHRFTVLVIYTGSLFWACSALLLRTLPEYVLLIFLPATGGFAYLALRHVMTQRARYPFLRSDQAGSVRNTALFGRCADLTDRLLPLLWGVLGLYALLGVKAAFANDITVPMLSLVLLVIGVGLRLRARARGEFQLLLAYAAVCLLAFVVWRAGEPLPFGVSVKRFGDLLLAFGLLVALLKLAFRRPGEFFLDSVDFLALALMVFLAIATREAHLSGLNLAGPLLRSMLLVFLVRTLAIRGTAARRGLINAALAVFALLTVAGVG